MATTTSTDAAPRVWLAGEGGLDVQPVDVAQVRDDQGRIWHLLPDGLWCDESGRHYQSWRELHARTDLIAVDTAGKAVA